MRELAEDLRDDDGTRLLFMDEVAERAGTLVSTIRAYNSLARRHRREGKHTTVRDFPAAKRSVRRQVTTVNGSRVTVVTPVWREDRIDTWLKNRLAPGRRPQKRATAAPAASG